MKTYLLKPEINKWIIAAVRKISCTNKKHNDYKK